jgi:hypothetical protein
MLPLCCRYPCSGHCQLWGHPQYTFTVFSEPLWHTIRVFVLPACRTRMQVQTHRLVVLTTACLNHVLSRVTTCCLRPRMAQLQHSTAKMYM